MSAMDKMLNGEYYISWDADLTAMGEEAKELLYDFNQLRPSQRAERDVIIRKLFSEVGKSCWIESPFNCDYGSIIRVGDNFYTNTNVTILDCAPVTIGNNVWIGPNVGLYTPEHAFDSEERAAGYERALPIVVEDNVWISGGVSIVGGVKIGRDSIIGAGAVVVRDVPERVVVAGNPVRVIREITEVDRLNLR